MRDSLAAAGEEMAGAKPFWSKVPASPLMCLRPVLVRKVCVFGPPRLGPSASPRPGEHTALSDPRSPPQRGTVRAAQRTER